MKKMYETKDLYLAAYLCVTGYDLKNHLRYSGETYFVFDMDNTIENEVLRFVSRRAMVEPIAFSQAMRSLKSVIYAIKDEDENNGKLTK